MNVIIGKDEFGKFVFNEESVDVTKCVYIVNPMNQDEYYARDIECVKDDVIYSTKIGCYIFTKGLSEQSIFKHTYIKGNGLYNYSFQKHYEAIDNFDIFNGKQIVKKHNNVLYADKLKYTFGLEFETSCGQIPQHLCFADGLIPLRDGSITGVEYSTVILDKSSGIDLLLQSINDLKKYTDFNKECSLHMHLGGYPVKSNYIFTLYSLCYILQRDFAKYCNMDVYNTANYKKTRKQYCNALPRFYSFNEFYGFMTNGLEYKNSLKKPHPDDVEGIRKWQIHTRYYNVNFINMICYDKAKTVEFRFLRPTYNFTKIYTWMLVFNAVLEYAEELTRTNGAMNIDNVYNTVYNSEHNNIYGILYKVYPESISERIVKCLNMLQLSSEMQDKNFDNAGILTKYEDELLDKDIYFY